MEDPRLEWKVEEEGSSDGSKMSMILNTGWRLAKKIVIVGVAITSAPIVLPPLVVFSTLGFAFAVPFSLVFASYACTDQLMSKMLSIPTPPPPMLEAKTQSTSEEEDDTEEVKLEEKRDEENVDKRVEDERGEENAAREKYTTSPSVEVVVHKDDSMPQQHISSEHGSAIDEKSVVHPVSLETAESKSTKGASEKQATIPSKKVLDSEVEIWKQINAMRAIVGYKAAHRTTSVEEVKALYIFTGVEPPISFKDPSNLMEVNDKLQFLMSIVGVK